MHRKIVISGVSLVGMNGKNKPYEAILDRHCAVARAFA